MEPAAAALGATNCQTLVLTCLCLTCGNAASYACDTTACALSCNALLSRACSAVA